MNKFDQNFDHNVHNTIRCRRACSSFHLNINLIGTLPYRVTSQRGYFHLHIYIYTYTYVCMHFFHENLSGSGAKDGTSRMWVALTATVQAEYYHGTV